MRLIRRGLAAALTVVPLLTTTAVGAAPGAVAPDAPDRPDRPDQSDPCGHTGAPGEILWSAPTTDGRGIPGAAAIAADGAAIFGAQDGVVYAVDCRGRQRWKFRNTMPNGVNEFQASPAIGGDGTIYVGEAVETPGLFFAIRPDGTERWRREIGANRGRISTSPAIDSLGRVFAAAAGGAQGISPAGVQVLEDGAILAFEPQNGAILPGFPITANPIRSAPVVLGGDRVVFASDLTRLIDFSPLLGTPTPTRPPTASPTRSPTPRTLPPMTHTPTPTRWTPTPSRVTGTPTPWGGTPGLVRARLYLPWAQAREDAPSFRPRPPAAPPSFGNQPPIDFDLPSAGDNQLAAGGDQPPTVTAPPPPPTPIRRSTAGTPGLPTATPFRPTVVVAPGHLHLVTMAQAPGKAFEIPAGAMSSIAGGGDTVVFQVDETAGGVATAVPRLVAFAVDAEPPRLLWQHRMQGRIRAAPVLGRLDAARGVQEVVYLDDSGRLVSLSAPAAGATEGTPTFNWAVQLPPGRGLNNVPAAGAPALGDAGIVYAASGGVVAAFDRQDGREIWSRPLPAGEVVLGSVTLAPGGTLYVGTRSGRLFAIATESEGLDPEALWPSLRHDARNTGRADE